MRALLLFSMACSCLAETTVRYWPGEHEKSVFAQWAMEAWAAGSGGLLKVSKAASAEQADVRFYWVNPRQRGLYGQSYSRQERGRQVADITINPSLESLGPDMAGAAAKDPLFGEVVLYLTCVHEAGHALGPVHTRDFADIMYSFEFGGDFVAYFQRYRNQLKSRLDIPRATPLSAGDVRQIKDWASRGRQSEKR